NRSRTASSSVVRVSTVSRYSPPSTVSVMVASMTSPSAMLIAAKLLAAPIGDKAGSAARSATGHRTATHVRVVASCFSHVRVVAGCTNFGNNVHPATTRDGERAHGRHRMVGRKHATSDV